MSWYSKTVTRKRVNKYSTSPPSFGPGDNEAWFFPSLETALPNLISFGVIKNDYHHLVHRSIHLRSISARQLGVWASTCLSGQGCPNPWACFIFVVFYVLGFGFSRCENHRRMLRNACVSAVSVCFSLSSFRVGFSSIKILNALALPILPHI